MNTIRIIADVHEKYDDYLKIIKDCWHSVQIGDLGYNNEKITKLVNSDNHKWMVGNHDNHDKIYKNSLNRYGSYTLNNINFFYIGGGFSIDWKQRKQAELLGYKKTWFENEELNYREGMDCIEQYEARKPDIVLSHEAPRFIVN